MNTTRFTTLALALTASVGLAETITGTVTWRTGETHQIDEDLVIEGSLTIEPGVQVYLNEGIHIDVTGALYAEGSENRPIRMSAGTDGSRNESVTWGSLRFAEGARGELRYVEFLDQWTTGVRIDGASPEFRDCEWSQINGVSGADAHGAYIIGATAMPLFRDCSFSGIYAGAGESMTRGTDGADGDSRYTTNSIWWNAGDGENGGYGTSATGGSAGGDAYGFYIMQASPTIANTEIATVVGGQGGHGNLGGNGGDGYSGATGSSTDTWFEQGGPGRTGGDGGSGGNGGSGFTGGDAFGIRIESPAEQPLVYQSIIRDVYAGNGGGGARGGHGGKGGNGGNGGSGGWLGSQGNGGNGGDGGNAGYAGNGGDGGSAAAWRVLGEGAETVFTNNIVGRVASGAAGSAGGSANGGDRGSRGSGDSNGSHGSGGTSRPSGSAGDTFTSHYVRVTDTGNASVYNSILGISSDTEIVTAYSSEDASLYLDHCYLTTSSNYYDGTAAAGRNNITGSAPGFVDADNDDFHLRSDSMGIDAGDSMHLDGITVGDLDMYDRFHDVPEVEDAITQAKAPIDIGPYEFGGDPVTESTRAQTDYDPGDRTGRIGTTADWDSHVTASYVTERGRVVRLRRSASGEWQGWLLDERSGEFSNAVDTGAFTDSRDGRTFVAVARTDGLLLVDPTSEASTDRDLTNEIAGSTSIVSKPTVFTSKEGQTYVAGFDADGHLVMYWQTGLLNANDEHVWAYTDISQDHLSPQGKTLPDVNGDLVSYVTDWNGLNIAFLDNDGNIWSVWWAPGASLWQLDNLSEINGAEPIVSGLSAYVTSWGGINLAGIDASGEVVVTWWVPEFGGDWVNDNLTSTVDKSDAESHTGMQGDMTSYVTPWGGLNLAGLDNEGNLVIYWWAPGREEWMVSPLSSLIPNAKVPSDSITGTTANDGTISLLGFAADDDIVHYHWKPGQDWQFENVTETIRE